MTDRVLAFNRFGIPLGELDATVVRSWRLERQVRAEAAAMQVRSSTVNRAMVQFRNLIVVLSDVVPTWCGVIWGTRDWEDNNYIIQMYSAEHLLTMRRSQPVEHYTGAPSAAYSGLLKTAQKEDSLLLQVSGNYISSGGAAIDKEYNRSQVFQAVNDLASEAEYYWWLEPVVSSTNNLTLRAMWRRQRGINYHRPLVHGDNFVDIKVSEICNVANRIYACGNFEDWHNPLEYIANDNVSRWQFGLIEDVISDHDIEDQAGLVPFGNAELNKRKQPRMRVEGKVLSTPFPKIGDNVTVLLSADSLGYSTGESVPARTSALRVKSVAYSPEEEGVQVIADNLYWEV